MEEFNREETYRFYVAKSLQIAPQGKSLVKSYQEILNPVPEDIRTGDEIVEDVMKRAGLSYEHDSI